MSSESDRAVAPDEDRFGSWSQALEARHLARLTFPEVRRALQALSSLYVERRGCLGAGAALEGEGKRAAFALFYGPLHFLLVRGIVRALGAMRPAARTIIDLGCGTGASGAAWASEIGRGCAVEAIDRSGWAVAEARWTMKTLGVRGGAARGDLLCAALPGRGGAVLAAFALNEIGDADRDRLLDRIFEAAARGAAVLVVEPIARRGLPWWDEVARRCAAAGGRVDEWRLPAELPAIVRRLDEAAGLNHRILTGRSLFVPAGGGPVGGGPAGGGGMAQGGGSTAARRRPTHNSA